jgi:hypothetical protein
MADVLKVFIGYDPAEKEAYEVAESSLRKWASSPVSVTPLRLDDLEHAGLMWRPWGRRGLESTASAVTSTCYWDVISNAPASTEFAISRFLTPLLAQTGLALFVDCDVVFLGDPYELVEVAASDPSRAVWVVKHDYQPSTATKMLGQPQTRYARKNWSSVMLFNCEHFSTRQLNLNTVNRATGRYLHSFGWLDDDDIGELEAGWNWLVNEQPVPNNLRIAHFTLGGPWLADWPGGPNDALWLEYSDRHAANRRAG